MPLPLFYLFAALAVLGGILLVALRNPVSSALSMVLSFVGLAALFIGLNAFFVGIVQILVYAGAIMVLFVFIIMLLDLNDEEKVKFRSSTIVAGVLIPLFLVFQIVGVIQSHNQGDDGEFQALTASSLKQSAAEYAMVDGKGDLLKMEEQPAIYRSLAHEKTPKLPDTNLIGQTIFTSYNFPLQVMGALLIVATVGTVVLSKRSNKKPVQS